MQKMLNYTKVDYDSLIPQIEQRLKTDGFENIIDSKVLMLCVDIFGASVDFIVYYIERRAEECFMDSAKLKSSIVLLSRQLGYSMKRPQPSSASINIKLGGSSTLVGEDVTDNRIQFPKYATKFSYNGKEFILKESYYYEIQASDDFGNPDWSLNLGFALKQADGSLLLKEEGTENLYPSEDIYKIGVIQGEIREFTFNSGENATAGDIFQRYSIPDLEFSNIFGSEDLSYDPLTGDYDLESGLTQVSITSPNEVRFDPSTLYKIDRRSLINHETLYRDSWDKFYTDGSFEEQNLPKVCVIRTARNESVELQFADGLISQYPKADQSIHIRYFATKGAEGNEVGTIGNKLNAMAKTYISSVSLLDISDTIEFTANSNISGGSDLEDMDSVKINAPSVYNSLDRLVSLGDYTSYLKSLSSPMAITNAVVWGEQEESRKAGLRAIQKFSNMVFYSCVGDMYLKTSDGRYIPKNLLTTDTYTQSEALTSLNYSALLESFDYTIYSNQSFFNILVADKLITAKNDERALYQNFFTRTTTDYTEDQVKMAETYPQGHPISQLEKKLETRAQLTIKHQYVSPLIQNFLMNGEVVLKDFADLSKTQARIESEVYKYLNENIGFNSPIYKSIITDIIKNDAGVLYCNFDFDAVASKGSVITDWRNEPEFQSQIPYEYSGLFVEQTPLGTHSIKIDHLYDHLDNGYIYDDSNYKEMNGKTIRFSQDGGTTYSWGEISEVNKLFTTESITREVYAIYSTRPPEGELLYDRYYLILDENIYIRKFKRKSVSIGNFGSLVNVIRKNRVGYGHIVSEIATGKYYKFTTQWDEIPLVSYDFVVNFTSEIALDVEIDQLSVDLVTNMESIMDDLGFCPKDYLIDGFTNTIEKEVQKLFDIIICKKCVECPTDEIPTDSEVVDGGSCKPLGVSRQSIGTGVIDGQCYNSSEVLTWDEYYTANNKSNHEKWTHCNELSTITQDDMYKGNYNASLDIAEFETIALPQYPFRQKAPEKGELSEQWITDMKLHHRIGGINERWFYTTLMKNVIIELRRIANMRGGGEVDDFYDTDKQILDTFLTEFGKDGLSFDINNIQESIVSLLSKSVYVEDADAIGNVEKFIASDSFKGLMFKLHNGLVESIRNSMLDKSGNITNYSIRNEIALITSNLVFRYR